MLIVIVILLLYVAFCGCIYFILRKKKTSLSWRQIALFFGCKIVAGCGYGYVYGKYYHGDDTWELNHDAYLQYQRLLHTPGLFFRDLLTTHPTPDVNLFFQDEATYLERLEYALTTKIMAPFNVISHGNYYINIVFFSFLTFWGAYLLYKLLVEQFFRSPHSPTVVPISISIGVFLFMPVVFWLSGYRGEGFLLLFTGILLYYFAQALKRPRAGNILLCLVSFLLAFVIRDSYALSLVPGLVAWWLIVRFSIRPRTAFVGIYLLLALLVLGSSLLPAPYNVLQSAVRRQQSFLILKGNTRFNLTPLQDNAISFVKVAPEALVNTLLRPWPWEAKGALQWLVALENIIVWSIVLVCITRFRNRIATVFAYPLAWILLCAAITNYFFIGYIVPFPGAIVRYRAMPELLILCLLAVIIGMPNTRLQPTGTHK